MGQIAIFTDDPGWHGKQLTMAFARRGYQSRYLSLTECEFDINNSNNGLKIPGFEQSLPDAVFVRGVPGGSLEEVVFYLDMLHALSELGIPVYNNVRAIEKSVDKAMTSFLLQATGIRTPDTWVLRDREKALAIVRNCLSSGQSLISKPLFGSQGEGIRRLEKMTDLFWLTSSNGIYYLQKFIDCQATEYSDIRVFVIAGVAVAAMKRSGKSWLNNVARGASCSSVLLDHALANIAIEATQALSMDYAGVDLILDDQSQYQVIEVNSIPAWKGLQGVCDVNIADMLVDDLIKNKLHKAIFGQDHIA